MVKLRLKRMGKKGDYIIVLPPLFNEPGLVNIKAIRLDQLPEFLMSYAYRPCHGYLLENMCHGSILIYSLEKSMGFA